MVHDKAVGTVVIETANEPVPQATTGAEAAPAPAMSVPTTGANPAKRPPLTSHLPIEPIVRWLRKYGTRLAVALIATAGIVITVIVVTNKISATNAYNHSPARAATAYLTALSGKDVPALEASAGTVTPTDVAPGVNVLLSEMGRTGLPLSSRHRRSGRRHHRQPGWNEAHARRWNEAHARRPDGPRVSLPVGCHRLRPGECDLAGGFENRGHPKPEPQRRPARSLLRSPTPGLSPGLGQPTSTYSSSSA